MRYPQRLALTTGLFALIAFVLGAAPAHAHPSAGIVRDRAGNVYYADLERVWQLSPDGRKRVVVSGVHTHELWLDSAGILEGGLPGRARVRRIDRDGRSRVFE